jgi:hypothetical protein
MPDFTTTALAFSLAAHGKKLFERDASAVFYMRAVNKG